MRPTRVWVLVIIALASLLVSWLVLRIVYASLPPLPWTAAVAMLLLAVAEAFSGRNLRARIRGGPGLKPIAPLAAVRMAALAKASSHAAAVIGGLAAGALVYLTSSLSKSVPRSDAITAGGTFLAAVLLVLAALYLENSCRVPSDDDQDADRDRAPALCAVPGPPVRLRARAGLAGAEELLAPDLVAQIHGVLAADHERRGTAALAPVEQAADPPPHVPGGQFRGVRPPRRRLIT
jgi:hypothetical protein